MSRATAGAAGVVASLALFVFYLSIIALAEGRAAVWPQLRQDLPYFAVLVPAFGTQIGLYTRLRQIARAKARAATAVAGTNAGVSGATMVACCAHFLPTLLPIVGISAVSAALAAWKTPLLLLAIAMNLAGIALVARALRRVRAHSTPARDPVCGMAVDPTTTPHTLQHGGATYFFCSASCKGRFEADPRRFLAGAP